MADPKSRSRRPPAALSFDPVAQVWQPAAAALAAVSPERLAPELLRGALSRPGPWPRDPLDAAESRHPGREGALVRAAVLIPLVAHASGVRVMLTQRAAHLHDHAGQISFPGGRLEMTDATPVAAALREANEETGLPADHVDVLGSMPAYLTSTGFSITPVLSLVRPGFTLAPDSFEVAEVFEVPLAFLMDPANHRLYRAFLPDGRERQYYAMPWQGHFIWGATAGMLRNLYHLVRHRLAADAP